MPTVRTLTDDGISIRCFIDCSFYDGELDQAIIETIEFTDPDGVDWQINEQNIIEDLVDYDGVIDAMDWGEAMQDYYETMGDYVYEQWKDRQWELMN